jgi:O-antigen/teichoic acid export membrane protein
VPELTPVQPRALGQILDRARRLLGVTGDGMARIIFRGGAISALLATIGLVLGLAIHVLLSRRLGVSQYGLYSIAVGWCLALATPATGGMDFTVLRLAPLYMEQGRHGEIDRLAGWVAIVLASTTMAAAIAIVAISAVAPRALGGATLNDAVWMALLVGATACLSAYSAFFRASQQIFFSQFYQQVVRSSLLLVAVLMGYCMGTDFDAGGAIRLTAMAAMVAMVLLLAHFTVAHVRFGSRDPEPAPVRKWMVLGGINLLITSLQQVQVQSGVLLLGAFSTPDQAGLYGAASRLAVFTTFSLSALAAITAPLIVVAWEKKDLRELARIAVVNARLAMAGALVVGLALVVAGPTLLGFFGADFAASYPALLVLLAGGTVASFTGASASLLMMTSHYRRVARVLALSVAAQIWIAALLIPFHGALGAAIAVAVGLSAANMTMAWIVWRLIGINATAIGVAATGNPRA